METKIWTGKEIKKLREELGITQSELGKRISSVLGLNNPKFYQQISRWETDTNNPSEIYSKALDTIEETSSNI